MKISKMYKTYKKILKKFFEKILRENYSNFICTKKFSYFVSTYWCYETGSLVKITTMIDLGILQPKKENLKSIF